METEKIHRTVTQKILSCYEIQHVNRYPLTPRHRIMSTFLKKLTHPKTGKEQIAVCYDNYYGEHRYGYGFLKDGSDFTMDLFHENKWIEKCDWFRKEDLTT